METTTRGWGQEEVPSRIKNEMIRLIFITVQSQMGKDNSKHSPQRHGLRRAKASMATERGYRVYFSNVKWIDGVVWVGKFLKWWAIFNRSHKQGGML